ncbi:tyrosine-type recombinase/integrase [Rhodovulum sulfidophilum]|uniref:tyrosine-type recombinase/integrase n=1 Tax=Rhodovulum sulfidophilum TaxID=35806 RepID=UPI00351AB8A6
MPSVRGGTAPARSTGCRGNTLQDGKLGGMLSLIKTSQDSGKWNFRYSFLGTRRNMGLGSWPEVGLADARRERDRWAAVLRAGRDPITERKEERAATKAQRDKTDPTFAEMAQLVFEARKATLRGGGERGRWFSPLQRHVLPHIGKMRVSEITPQDIKGALAPIWRAKFPTAEKALQRTRIVLHEGRLMGFGCDPFSAEAAQRMLGAVIHTPKHIPATPWQDMPALYARLNAGTVGHECLRFMMLPLVRYMGCAGARAAEVDGDVWTVPPKRMKGTLKHVREFRVPLTDPALAIVQRQKEAFGDTAASVREGGPKRLSVMPRCRRSASGRGCVETLLSRIGKERFPWRPACAESASE